MGSVLCCSCNALCLALSSCQPTSNSALKASYLWLLFSTVLLSLCFLYFPLSADLLGLAANLDCGTACSGRIVTLLWLSFAGLSVLQALLVLIYRDGCVFIKFCIYLGLFIGSLWLPEAVVQWYVWSSDAAYLLFYILQSVLVVVHSYSLNDYLYAYDSVFYLFGTTILAVLGSVACLGLSLWHYYPLEDLVLFFLCFTAGQIILLALVSQLPCFENGSLLTSSVTGTYISYLCLNYLRHTVGKEGWMEVTTGLEVLIAAGILLWTTSTWGLAEDSEIAEPLVDKERKEQADGSGEMLAFHLVLLLTSLFFTVSLRSLTYTSAVDSDFLLWGKFAAQCVASGLFLWTLLAPVLLPDRFDA